MINYVRWILEARIMLLTSANIWHNWIEVTTDRWRWWGLYTETWYISVWYWLAIIILLSYVCHQHIHLLILGYLNTLLELYRRDKGLICWNCLKVWSFIVMRDHLHRLYVIHIDYGGLDLLLIFLAHFWGKSLCRCDLMWLIIYNCISICLTLLLRIVLIIQYDGIDIFSLDLYEWHVIQILVFWGFRYHCQPIASPSFHFAFQA